VRFWWLRKDTKAARDQRILDLWMACYSQEEIGEAVGMTSQGVGQILKETATVPDVSKPYADRLVDFDIPINNT